MASMPPDLVVAALAFFRVGGLMLVAPVLSARTIPRMVRAGIAVLLTVLVLPTVGEVPSNLVVGPGTLVAELLVGLGMAWEPP